MANSDQKEKQYTPKPGVHIYLRGNYWMLRYRIPVEVNGERKLKDQYKKLARREEYDSPRSVEHLAKPYLNSLPDKLTTATTQSVSSFIKRPNFPYAEQNSDLAPSTIFWIQAHFLKAPKAPPRNNKALRLPYGHRAATVDSNRGGNGPSSHITETHQVVSGCNAELCKASGCTSMRWEPDGIYSRSKGG